MSPRKAAAPAAVEGALVAHVEPQQQTAIVAVENPFMAMAQQLVASGNLDQLERILELQQKFDREEARKAFVRAMSALKGEAMTIFKRKKVSFGDTEYMHAELSDVLAVVVPRMCKFGLSHRWDVTQSGQAITVACILTHEAGHSERVEMTGPPDPSGKKNAIQAIASTKSYLERYTFLAATGMTTTGIDNDGHGYGQTLEADNTPTPRTTSAVGEKTPAQLARDAAKRKREHDEAAGRNSESITFIKERIDADDYTAARSEWAGFTQKDQLALWLAPSKGGCLTTQEREILKSANVKPKTTTEEE